MRAKHFHASPALRRLVSTLSDDPIALLGPAFALHPHDTSNQDANASAQIQDALPLIQAARRRHGKGPAQDRARSALHSGKSNPATQDANSCSTGEEPIIQMPGTAPTQETSSTLSSAASDFVTRVIALPELERCVQPTHLEELRHRLMREITVIMSQFSTPDVSLHRLPSASVVSIFPRSARFESRPRTPIRQSLSGIASSASSVVAGVSISPIWRVQPRRLLTAYGSTHQLSSPSTDSLGELDISYREQVGLPASAASQIAPGPPETPARKRLRTPEVDSTKV